MPMLGRDVSHLSSNCLLLPVLAPCHHVEPITLRICFISSHLLAATKYFISSKLKLSFGDEPLIGSAALPQVLSDTTFLSWLIEQW